MGRGRRVYLATPGPVEVPLRVLRALSRKPIHPFYDKEFSDLYKESVSFLREVIGTEGDVLILPGGGSLGIEAAIANIIGPGDKVLVLSNGFFGEVLKHLVNAYGGNVLTVDAEYGEIVEPAKVGELLEENPDVKSVVMVHCETSTGVVNPLEEIAREVRERSDAILIVDAISTLGAMPIKADAREIDIVIGASQKALSVIPGLAIVSVSERAWKAIERRGYKGHYMNLKLWNRGVKEGKWPSTFPVNLLYALHEALRMIFEEGLERVFERHRFVGGFVRSLVKSLNLRLVPLKEEYASDTVTVFYTPESISPSELRDHLLRRYKVMIAGGLGTLRKSTARIGHMGYGADKRLLKAVSSALVRSLRDLGYSFDLERVEEVLKRLE